MKSTLFFGVDVAQHRLAIAQADGRTVREIENTTGAIRVWLRTLPARACIGVESTGELHRRLVRLGIGAGHTLYVLNARDLAHYARALGRRAKTDRLDATLIARYLQKEYEHLHPYRLPSELQSQLDELISRRHKVVVAYSSLRQSFAAAQCKPRELARVMRSLHALIEALASTGCSRPAAVCGSGSSAHDSRLWSAAQHRHGPYPHSSSLRECRCCDRLCRL